MRKSLIRGPRPICALAPVLASLLLAAPADAALPAPCRDIGAGRHSCTFYPAGDGHTGGSPVQAGDGHIVGYLHRGSNWVVCEASGASVARGSLHNHIWAWTTADDGARGWVNALYASGGENDGGFAGTPTCGAGHGSPPGQASASPVPPRPPVPGSTLPQSSDACISPTFRFYLGSTISHLRYARAEATFTFCAGERGKDIQTRAWVGGNATGENLGLFFSDAQIVTRWINNAGGEFDLVFRSKSCLPRVGWPCRSSGDWRVRFLAATFAQTGPGTTRPAAHVTILGESAPDRSLRFFDTP